MKKIVKFFTLSIGLIYFGCTNNYSLAQESDIPSWRVKVARPSYYPIKAIEIYGINNKEDWTVPLMGLVRAGNSSSLKSVRRYYDKNYYDGYGIVLTPYLNSTLDQPMRNSVPPDSMYIKWISLFDNTLYYTKIHFSDDVLNYMTFKDKHRKRKSTCYHNTIVLGFLPNGHVKTWLFGCSEYVYLGEQEPDKTIKTKVPNEYDPNDYTFYIDPLIKNAKKEGSSIIPVPWDRVDKVTIPPINYRLENFSDIDKSSFQ